jgi:hypothetical protein
VFPDSNLWVLPALSLSCAPLLPPLTLRSGSSLGPGHGNNSGGLASSGNSSGVTFPVSTGVLTPQRSVAMSDVVPQVTPLVRATGPGGSGPMHWAHAGGTSTGASGGTSPAPTAPTSPLLSQQVPSGHMSAMAAVSASHALALGGSPRAPNSRNGSQPGSPYRRASYAPGMAGTSGAGAEPRANLAMAARRRSALMLGTGAAGSGGASTGSNAVYGAGDPGMSLIGRISSRSSARGSTCSGGDRGTTGGGAGNSGPQAMETEGGGYEDRPSHSSESSSKHSSGSDPLEALGLPPGVDPFGNFSFTNYTTLSQVCMRM